MDDAQDADETQPAVQPLDVKAQGRSRLRRAGPQLGARRLGILAILVVALIAVSAGLQAVTSPSNPAWQYGPGGSQAAVESPSSLPSVSPTPSSDPIADEVDGDEGISLPTAWLAPRDGRIQLYPDKPSVLPGEALKLRASSDAGLFSLVITRDGARPHVVFRHSGYVVQDSRDNLTIDQAMLTVRANWPVVATIPTAHWAPGVYVAAARDSRGRTSSALFVVRSPEIRRTDILYTLPVMTYQAYNIWGGSDLYSTPRAYRVSFDRPYAPSAGLAQYPAYDRLTLVWAEKHGYHLAFTTDYDLAAGPPATAPAVLLLLAHTEYVPASLYNWVDEHVNRLGDMNVALFGANTFYWQARLARGPQGVGRPSDIVSYKDCGIDPVTARNPALTTCRWREAPVNRPETGLWGAMYSGIVGTGHSGFDLTLTGQMPSWAIEGTGWAPGTVLGGLLGGEADMTSTRDGGVMSLASVKGPASRHEHGTIGAVR